MIDLRGKSSITDYMIIASGNSKRQIIALAEYIQAQLKAMHKHVAIEGATQGDWVLIDAGDVVVHLFRPEVRSFYNLEKMWEADLPLVAIA